MPGLFDTFTLKGVTLRNRIAMSPMTMHRSVDGRMDDFHVMYLGARAAGGFGLVFPEQVAITPDGRTTTGCAGIYEDSQMDGHARVTSMIRSVGAVAGIQLGHTGRKGSELPPWEGRVQVPPEDPRGWQCVGPSPVPYGGFRTLPVHELTRGEIGAIHGHYRDAARRAAAAGYEWLELHFAHGYLASSFLSPIANKRTDEYGGRLENRARFCLEAIDAVREVWPERLPLTMRLGSDDLHPDGLQFEESITLIGWMKDHGLDLADLSIGLNTNDMTDPPFKVAAFMIERAARIRDAVELPVAASWNLGVPATAEDVVRRGKVDLVMLGRPALANPHWPIWAARELGHPAPFDMLIRDWSYHLNDYRGHEPSIGWP